MAVETGNAAHNNRCPVGRSIDISPGRRAAVASSKLPRISLARGKEGFRNRRLLPEPNAFAEDLV